jgi:hypothetical protein
MILKNVRKAIFLRECFLFKNSIFLLSKVPMASSQAKSKG